MENKIYKNILYDIADVHILYFILSLEFMPDSTTTPNSLRAK